HLLRPVPAARSGSRRGGARAPARPSRPAWSPRRPRPRAVRRRGGATGTPRGSAQAQGGDMRIVGGRFRGRPLFSPSGDRIRPTSDRVREALFNVLHHAIPGLALADAKVLDLFAGTGALGLEALSRGAAFCLFVEEAVEARALIRRNIEALALMGVTR